jgi:hypothetical protein
MVFFHSANDKGRCREAWRSSASDAGFAGSSMSFDGEITWFDAAASY